MGNPVAGKVGVWYRGGRKGEIGMRYAFAVVAVFAACLHSPTNALSQQSSGTFSAQAAAMMGRGESGASDDDKVSLSEENLEEWLTKHLAETRERLAIARRGVVRKTGGQSGYNERTKRYLFRSLKEQGDTISRLEDELLAPTIPPLQPIIGQVGTLANPFFAYEVVQITNKTTAMIDVGRWSFILRSPVVMDLHESQRLESIPGTYKVTGKRTYTTVLGAERTVDVVEPFDIKPALERARAREKPAKAAD
jgi:hypothetical protein